MNGIGRRGTAAVELGLIAPLLFLLLAGTVDIGRAYQQRLALSAAIAAAAQYALLNAASVNSSDAASLAATLSGIVASANGTNWANATVNVNGGATSTVTGGTTTAGGTAANSANCWCPTGSSGSWTWGSATTCGTACAGGTLAGKFVTLSGTRSFTPIFAGYGWFGGGGLSQAAIVQVQ